MIAHVTLLAFFLQRAPPPPHAVLSRAQVNWVTGKSWDGVELSIGALLGWLYSLTFARGMRQIGHLVVRGQAHPTR